MEVHTFRAASLQEALQQVRHTLGPDASVLHTRERRSSRLGFFSKLLIEVDATVDVPAASRFPVNSAHVAPQPAQPSAASRPAEASQPALDPRPATGESVVSQPSATPPPSANLPSRLSRPDQPIPPGSPPSGRQTGNLSPALFEVFSDLLDGGVDPQVARDVVREAGESCTEAEAQDPWVIRGRLSQLLSSKLRVSGSIELREHQPQVVALVGPTGVGKTTTLAKIAAGFRFDLGCQVGLITLDTFRLGAVDQLLQYAELISAPLEVVSSPDQVGSALKRLSQCDLVLLDTAGRSPKDTQQLSLLRDFLRCAEPASTHLVLSATSSVEHVRDSVQQFSMLEPTSLLITKLDEAVRFGSWLAFLQEAQLPISYLTTGQHVPQDIVVASPRRMASLLLGNGQPTGSQPQGHMAQ